jgi:uncharacterized membrane protein
MKKDKFRIILMIIVTSLVLVTSLLYGTETILKDKTSPGNFIAFIIPLLVVIFMVFLIEHRYRDIKEGMPLEDERSRKVTNRAAATTFYISLYWLMFISFFEAFFARLSGAERLDAGQTTGIGIAGMAIIFIISWFYYNYKGKLL